MLTLHQYYEKVLQETDMQQVVEINIPGAGQMVSSDTGSSISMNSVIGIALINPNPKTAGHGTLRLRIGDKEILPNGFHADLISKFGHNGVDSKAEFAFREYLFPVETGAKGKPVRIEYTEPSDGGSGNLYLYLLGSKGPNTINIPKYRFQVLGFTVPKGNSDKDIELDIGARTLLGHKRVAGAFFLGPSNRIKETRLCIDETTVFPSGMPGQLVTKEIVNARTTGNGIFTKHILPFPHVLQACDLAARNSKIEGKLLVTPNPDGDYKVFLYLLTTV